MIEEDQGYVSSAPLHIKHDNNITNILQSMTEDHQVWS